MAKAVNAINKKETKDILVNLIISNTAKAPITKEIKTRKRATKTLRYDNEVVLFTIIRALIK